MSTLHERMQTPEECAAGQHEPTSVQGGFLSLRIERAVTVNDGYGGGEIYPEGQCQAERCVHGHWFGEGEPYVTFGGGHMHVDCLNRMAAVSSRLDFLLLLAAHVARAPSLHNAGTVRQVINGLTRALGVVQREAVQREADAYARGAAEAAQAIAEQGGSVGPQIDVEAAIRDAEDEGQ